MIVQGSLRIRLQSAGDRTLHWDSLGDGAGRDSMSKSGQYKAHGMRVQRCLPERESHKQERVE